MSLTESSGEIQLVGSKYDGDVAEVRFTMTRQSVDDDVKITRILGGVE